MQLYFSELSPIQTETEECTSNPQTHTSRPPSQEVWGFRALWSSQTGKDGETRMLEQEDAGQAVWGVKW